MTMRVTLPLSPETESGGLLPGPALLASRV